MEMEMDNFETVRRLMGFGRADGPLCPTMYLREHMRIDIRQLRIGAHVEYEGKRARIEQLSTIHLKNEPVDVVLRCGSDLVLIAPLDEIEPIAITPSLLAELGFEDKSHAKWHSPSWALEDDDCAVIFEKRPSSELWEVFCIKGGIDRGFCVCRYLHEAEAFLALHNVELIAN